MVRIVDQCVAAGLILGPGQCYGFKTHPVLGGEYTVENIAPISLVEHYTWMAEFWRQTRDLSDGTPVRLVVRNPPQTEY